MRFNTIISILFFTLIAAQSNNNDSIFSTQLSPNDGTNNGINMSNKGSRTHTRSHTPINDSSATDASGNTMSSSPVLTATQTSDNSSSAPTSGTDDGMDGMSSISSSNASASSASSGTDSLNSSDSSSLNSNNSIMLFQSGYVNVMFTTLAIGYMLS
ncbi:hypothetical protein K502DRAFT_344401 [Neoconidiobolus thromboides FSU 785]|nr:hypothetical protein K502DRAFT_344401 [Neoconidiobolus thromboides FSU 785]